MLCALIYEVGYVCCVLKHVSNSTCSTCFYYWLRQIRRIRRCLDTESATTLVHTMTASRVDYCNSVLAGHRKLITDSFIGWTFPNMSSISSDSRSRDVSLTAKSGSTVSAGSTVPMRTVHLTFPAISELWSANRHQLVVPRSKFDR